MVNLQNVKSLCWRGEPMGVSIVPRKFQVEGHFTYDPQAAARFHGANVIDKFPMARELRFYKCCA